MKYYLILALICFWSIEVTAQRVIAVQNPSFEKDQLWHSCIFAAKHFSENQSEDNRNNSAHNMVSQSDGTFEGISQRLNLVIQKDNCYQFTFYARRDSDYIHNPLDTTVDHAASNPLYLYIYGAEGNCGFGELIAAPLIITSHQWTKYVVTLQSQSDWTHLNLYAMRADNKSYNGYVLFHQQGPILPTYCFKNIEKGTNERNDLFKVHPYNVLTFGGILMLYEVGPRSINIFDAKGEIEQSFITRKDESRNYTLDSVLNQYRGINYLFLILKNKKYRHKRLNLISYLKTKYTEVLQHSKIIRYSALPANLYRKEDNTGDLLVVENINDNIK